MLSRNVKTLAMGTASRAGRQQSEAALSVDITQRYLHAPPRLAPGKAALNFRSFEGAAAVTRALQFAAGGGWDASRCRFQQCRPDTQRLAEINALAS